MKIIYGITGSIAAIKSPIVARELMRAGAEVHPVMTDSAEKFVTPYALSVLTKNETIRSIFSASHSSTWHIHLGRSVDAMLIAPCSTATLGKLRYGIYDNAVLLAAASLRPETPLVIAPAMDEEMWLQPAVQENILWLKSKGVRIIEPISGELASGFSGMGRMKEPDELVREFEAVLSNREPRATNHEIKPLPLQAKRILITGGPTYEPIDPVRFIGNRSSGKMGAALATVAWGEFGANVTLVMGPSSVKTNEMMHRIDVETTEQMHSAVTQQALGSDIIIMSAAVSDYKIKEYSDSKLKKSGKDKVHKLELEPTTDILKDIAKHKKDNQIIVGFALESKERGEEYAKRKLEEKSLDMIVLNYFDEDGAGFSTDTNRVTIFTKNGKRSDIALSSKTDCAREILNRVVDLIDSN
ncbi:MAG TPA: bifunctional phosphopantothenoylcysteine decarboxylase/phosphopantothenate--cysteine ligase CoaBC [Candidatus Kapabacteria bacterium]|nr:bifunctional phosphopantothenoylcysteine decarboxylase/phosphopantothenate--cysteine ligase CoaBC [Candidatus Kapabacteria bacterium]